MIGFIGPKQLFTAKNSDGVTYTVEAESLEVACEIASETVRYRTGVDVAEVVIDQNVPVAHATGVVRLSNGEVRSAGWCRISVELAALAGVLPRFQINYLTPAGRWVVANEAVANTYSMS